MRSRTTSKLPRAEAATFGRRHHPFLRAVRLRTAPGTRLPEQDRGTRGFAELTTGSENIERAVQTFTHPDVESSEKATAVALGELKQRVPAPRDTSITVLNGNGVAGSASTAGFQLGERGYEIDASAERPRPTRRGTPTFGRRSTSHPAVARPVRRRRASRTLRLVRGERAAERDLASLERRAADHRRRPDVPRQSGRSSDRPDAQAGRERRVCARGRPRASPRAALTRSVPADAPDRDRANSWTDSTMPVRMYWIDPGEKHKAVRRVQHGLERVLGRADDGLGRRSGARGQEPHPADQGRIYDLYHDGRSCAWSSFPLPTASYWVINTCSTAFRTRRCSRSRRLKPLGRAK